METGTVAGKIDYSEYSYEKAEKKSRTFLRDIMGQELYDNFIRHGKIEIESGGNTYELYESGRVINKTVNQSYCIIPDRSDYPDYDVIAIKYCWLKYGVKTVERVANRTSLNTFGTGQTPTRDIGYAGFIDMMEQRGWRHEQLSIDEYNTNIATTNNVDAGSTQNVIDIRCPAGRSITIMGVQQVPNGVDFRAAHRLVLDIRDEHGVEIPPYTKIRIAKIKPCETVIQLVRDYYSIFSSNRAITTEIGTVIVSKADNELYRWRRGVMLNGEEYLKIYIINSEVKIPSSNVKFTIDMDFWMR